MILKVKPLLCIPIKVILLFILTQELLHNENKDVTCLRGIGCLAIEWGERLKKTTKENKRTNQQIPPHFFTISPHKIAYIVY